MSEGEMKLNVHKCICEISLMMYSILSVILKNIGAFIFYIIIFYYNIMADKRKIENLKQPQLSRQATVELPSQMDPEGETKKAAANEARPEAARATTDDYEIQGSKKKQS